MPKLSLALQGLVPLASGQSRVVYAHPSNFDLLIKVMRADFLARRKADTTWFNGLKPTRTYSIFVREIREQLILAGKGEAPSELVTRIHGFCDSDLGLAMITEAARDPDGALAPSLAKLLRENKFKGAVEIDFERFCSRLIGSAITLGWLAPGNLLYATDSSGGRRFVLVDGYGEGALIPFKGISARMNRAHKKRVLQRLRHTIARQRQRIQG